MLILPKIKFKRDPEELEEEFEEELEEKSEEESVEESEEEPEEESGEDPETELREDLEEGPEEELLEKEIPEEEIPEEETPEEETLEEEIPEEEILEEEILIEDSLEESFMEESEPEDSVTEAIPIPEKEKKIRKKKPKTLLCFKEETDGIRIAEMIGEEEQQTLFVPFYEEDETETEGEILPPEQVGKRIKKALRQNKIRCRRAAFIVPEEESTIRSITIPIMPEKQIRYNIPAEFRQDFKEGLKGLLFDYAHIEEEEPEISQEIHAPEEAVPMEEPQDQGPVKAEPAEEPVVPEIPTTMDLVTAAVPSSRMERIRLIAAASGLKLLVAAPESLSRQSFFSESPFLYGKKYTINFAHVGEKRLHPAAAATIAAGLVLCALAVAKFGVIDRFEALQKSVEELEELRNEVENGKAELASGDATAEEYAHYTWSGMTDEECEQIERIRIGALLNYIATQGASVKSASLSGTLLTVSVTADSLETISQLTASIEEQDIVESCTVTTAQKEEMRDDVNYAAPPSDVMEVEVDDSVTLDETQEDADEKPEKDSKDDEDASQEADGEEEAPPLPEVEYPEGTVEAQLRIYLKKRSDTVGSAEGIDTFEQTQVEEETPAEPEEEATEEEAEEEEAKEEEQKPSKKEKHEEDKNATDESNEDTSGDGQEDANLPTIVMDENGNPVMQGDAGETY